MTSLDDQEFERTIFITKRPAQDVPPAEAIGHYLVMVDGTEPGRRFEITAEPTTIGRDAQQTLVLADTELSRRHARVSLVKGETIVEDLGSTNGTFLNGKRITTPSKLGETSVLRLGKQSFRYERRSRRDVEKAEELDRELLKANKYVFSLLPAPLETGAVHAEWQFVPSTQLGGDAFGYYWLDSGTFVFYLIDVSGHGVGSAMHSVTVLNVLRQRALPGVDFTDPAAVLSSLNTRFQMSAHNGLFFTMWYGVYRVGDRSLTCASAGHHAAYLVGPDKASAQPLGAPAMIVGILPGSDYETQQATVPQGSSLYLFSDGVFEILTKEQQRWTLPDFLPLLLEARSPGTSEPERIYRQVQEAAAPGPLDDDFSLMAVSFP